MLLLNLEYFSGMFFWLSMLWLKRICFLFDSFTSKLVHVYCISITQNKTFHNFIYYVVLENANFYQKSAFKNKSHIWLPKIRYMK